MTPAQLVAWRKSRGMTQTEAAEALGCGRRSLQTWESGQSPIPRYIGLACAAIALGLTSYPDEKAQISAEKT